MNFLRVGWPPVWMTDSTQWWDFWHNIVERYDGDGDSLDMPRLIKPIKYWEICNEPNDKGGSGDNCYGGTVEHFRDYVRISWKAIHDADTSSNVYVVAPCINDSIWYYANHEDSCMHGASPKKQWGQVFSFKFT